MSEWVSLKLRELVGAPISGRRPVGGVSTETEGVPSLGGENIRADGGVSLENVNRVPDKFYRHMPKGRLQALDVLINKDGAQTGKVGIYGGDFPEAGVNEHIFILRSNNGSIDQRLLYYYLLLPDTQAKISRRITGSAQPGLNSVFVDAIEIKIPKNATNQHRIASILSTIDEAIEQTEALIAKTQQIKAGLMHDLFTRGVLPNGHLRPSHEEAPVLYKDSRSPLGWVPKEWEVAPLSEFLEGGPKNGYSPPEVFEWDGMYSLGLGCLTVDGFRAKQLKIVSAVSQACHDAVVKDGDFLLSRANTQELVGLCGIFRDVGGPCIYPDLMMRLKPNRGVSTAFLEQLLLSPLMRLQITAAAVGTSGSMVKLNSRSVLRLMIAGPQEEEQQQILVAFNYSDRNWQL